MTSDSGTALMLGDIATIRDGFTEGKLPLAVSISSHRFELQIYRVGGPVPAGDCGRG